jgi:hypothetical protein
MQSRIKNLSFNILFSTIIAALVYACYSTGPILDEDEPKESFPLKVTGQGSSKQTWVGPDGRTYVLTFSEPVYRPANNDK